MSYHVMILQTNIKKKPRGMYCSSSAFHVGCIFCFGFFQSATFIAHIHIGKYIHIDLSFSHSEAYGLFIVVENTSNDAMLCYGLLFFFDICYKTDVRCSKIELLRLMLVSMQSTGTEQRRIAG